MRERNGLQGLGRRALLEGALGTTLGVALAPLARAQAGRTRPVVTRLKPDVLLIPDGRNNTIAVASGGNVIVVDGGSREHADTLAAEIAEAFGGRPIRTLINTHWHPGQTGANLSLARRGARIVSHINTRLWLGTDIERPWEDFVHARLPAEALPELTFYESSRELELGAVPFECRYLLQAHTDGDCCVYFENANVLCCGGVIAGDRWPLIDWWTGGWLGGLVEGIETLLQVADGETIVVPAEGPVLRYADLVAQRDMYAELFVRFRDDLLFKGMSPAEAVAARPAADYHVDWSNRDEFVTLAFQSLWGYYAPDV